MDEEAVEEIGRLAMGVRRTRVSARDVGPWLRAGHGRFAPGEMAPTSSQNFSWSGRERVRRRRHGLPLLESVVLPDEEADEGSPVRPASAEIRPVDSDGEVSLHFFTNFSEISYHYFHYL